MRVNTTLVINPKGGSGKTTVATNLASYFASKGVATTLLDYDPQGSSLNWLRTRPLQAAKRPGATGPIKPQVQPAVRRGRDVLKRPDPCRVGIERFVLHVQPFDQRMIIGQNRKNVRTFRFSR